MRLDELSTPLGQKDFERIYKVEKRDLYVNDFGPELTLPIQGSRGSL